MLIGVPKEVKTHEKWAEVDDIALEIRAELLLQVGELRIDSLLAGADVTHRVVVRSILIQPDRTGICGIGQGNAS